MYMFTGEQCANFILFCNYFFLGLGGGVGVTVVLCMGKCNSHSRHRHNLNIVHRFACMHFCIEHKLNVFDIRLMRCLDF